MSSIVQEQQQHEEHPARHRRAGRACLGCRARKVRCNFFESHPCSNCRWNRIPCIVPRSRRRARKYLYEDPDANADEHNTPSESGLGDPDDVEARVACLKGIKRRKTLPREAQSPVGIGTVESSGAASSRAPPPELPPYVKPPAAIEHAYTAFLESQGAYKLPSISLQCALIRSYVEFAYPRMPIIDLEDFCKTLRCADGSTGQVSLLLYQAVLFAGSSYVSNETKVDDEFVDKMEMRRELYRRTKLLFELGAETDRVVLLQTALLLATRSVSQHDTKDSWHWLNTAISLAFAMSLHKTAGYGFSTASRESRTLRRIWWSCYLRDKILALGVNRPSRIKDEDSDVEMLQLADLEVGCLSSRLTILGHGHLGPYEDAKQVESAELLIEKTKLFMLINRILQFQQRLTAVNYDGTVGIANTIAQDSFDAIEKALKKWLVGLPACCRWRSFTDEDRKDSMHTSVHVRRNLLHMAYNTAVYSLHRPRFLPFSPRQAPAMSISQEERDMSRSVVLDSVNKITHLAAELHHHKMDDNLPLAAITVLYPAICMHLINMKSRDRETREAAIHRFRVCMRILEKLRDVYSSTDVTIGYLEVVLRNAFVVDAPWASTSAEGVFQLNKQDHTDIEAVLGYGLSPDTSAYVGQEDVVARNGFSTSSEGGEMADMDMEALFREVCPGSPVLALETLMDLDFAGNVELGQLDVDWPILPEELEETETPSDEGIDALLDMEK